MIKKKVSVTRYFQVEVDIDCPSFRDIIERRGTELDDLRFALIHSQVPCCCHIYIPLTFSFKCICDENTLCV